MMCICNFRHKINIEDENRFPNGKRKWKAYVELLAKEGIIQKHSWNKCLSLNHLLKLLPSSKNIQRGFADFLDRYPVFDLSKNIKYQLSFGFKPKLPFLLQYADTESKKCYVLNYVYTGLSHTEHHEEIPADTQDKIYKLLYHTFKALEATNHSSRMKHLSEIPQEYHQKLHYLAQYGVQVLFNLNILLDFLSETLLFLKPWCKEPENCPCLHIDCC